MKLPGQLQRAVQILFVLATLLISGRPAWADEVALTQIVQAGETVVFTIELHNQGSTDHSYTPTLTGLPDTVSIRFGTGGRTVESITVPAGGTGLLNAHVSTLVTTPVGSHRGAFTAVRDDGRIVGLPVTLLVENTFALEIVSQNVTISTFSGQSFTFEVVATNAGAETVQKLFLQVATPPKWIVQTEPTQVATLEPGAETAFQVQVAVPASQVAIDQPVTVVVVADEVSSPEGKLIVRVQKNASYLLAAGGIVAVAVASVFVYFRVHGRR